MNFRWSNIYVLQFLFVLDVNGLKLVPADRTVIKQNGTTRTISRYFLLPQEADPNHPNLSNDAGFSKFLREFDKKSDKKKTQPGKKKVVDRYRIYIRRKLKKNPNKDVSKSGNITSLKNRTDVMSTSTEYLEITSQVPAKMFTQVVPETVSNPDDEYILKKKQVELSAAFPNYVFGQKPRDTNENVLDLKDPYEILKAAAAAQAQKQLAAFQANQTADASGKLLIQSEGKEAATTNEPEITKLKRPIETLSQAEINELYAKLYGKYIPGQTKQIGNQQSEVEKQGSKINVGLDGNGKKIPDHLHNDAAFKLLSALHERPEKFTEQAVTNSNLEQTSADGKELASKLVEMTYEEPHKSQSLNPSLIIDSYDTTSPGTVKDFQLAGNGKENNAIKAKNPLESYFLKFGIQDHDHLFNDQPPTVDNPTTSTTTTSYESPDRWITTENTLTVGNLPYLGYQSNAEYTENQKNPLKVEINEGGPNLLKHPLLGYKGNLDFTNGMKNPTLIGFNHAGIEHTEPPMFGISKGGMQFSPGFKGSIDYSQGINKPGNLGYNQENIEYSEANKNPAGGLEYSQTLKQPFGFGFNQGGIDYSQAIKKPGAMGYNQGLEYSVNMNNPDVGYQATTESQFSRVSSQLPYNTANGEYIENLKNPDQVEGKYAQSQLFPKINYNLADYSKTSRSPSSMVNTPIPLDDEDLEYKFNTEYVLPSTENSSVDNTTDENELRGGIGEEWTTLYQDVLAEDEEPSRKPKIEIGTNLVQIGTGNGVVNYPAQNNIDLASLCPECFMKIQAELARQMQAGITTGSASTGSAAISNAAVMQLFKDTNIASQLQTITQQQVQQQQQIGQQVIPGTAQGGLFPSASGTISGTVTGSITGSMAGVTGTASGGINTQGIIELIQNLDAQNQNQQQQLPLPEKDQSLVKILEIVLKDTEGQSVANFQDGSAQLFTIENLRKVLDALERQRQQQPVIDKETANLHMIMRLIFEIAMKQSQEPTVNDANAANAYWFTQISAFMGNPLIKYVYNLIRQSWLQEIMIQLYQNNYNLNVIRNPRWAAYLGAWRLPMKLVKYINTNYEYYDQNEYGGDYDGNGDYIQDVIINPQSDAGVILNFLRNYLIQAQYYEQNGSVDYFRKQTEIFSRIAAYLRQRGYAVGIIQRLIRKLYAVLNANSALVTVARPACINRH